MHLEEQLVSPSLSDARRVTVCTELGGPYRGCLAGLQ